MPMPRRVLTFFALALAACGSKVESTVDQAVLDKVTTVQQCFPALFRWAQGVLAIADAWRLTGGAADPSGLTWAYNPSTKVFEVQLVVGATTTTMDIGCHSPTGALVDVSAAIGAATTLSDAIAAAAADLRANFSDETFLLGAWSISGGGIAATGEGLCGVIAAAAQPLQLVRLFTSATTVSGGLPAIASSTIDETATGCSLTFTTPAPGLANDDSPTQTVPTGEVDVTLVGSPTTVEAVVTLAQPHNATIVVTGVSGQFGYDLETRAVSYRF